MSNFTKKHYNTIGSTNAEAIELLGKGEITEKTVVYADVQEAGRGRTGREWKSPEGNLYSSFVIPFDESQPPNVIPFSISLAVYDVLTHFMDEEDCERIGLKWPNDVLIDGAKCCGILIEKASDDKGREWYVIGIGLNLVFAPQDVQGGSLYGSATCLSYYTTFRPSREAVLNVLMERLNKWSAPDMPSKQVYDNWRANCYGRDSMIVVRLANGETEPGIFDGIDDSGFLLLKKTGGEIKKIASADVFFDNRKTV